MSAIQDILKLGESVSIANIHVRVAKLMVLVLDALKDIFWMEVEGVSRLLLT